MAKPLNILLATSEVAPLAKTGGLADVCDALPKSLVALGHRVDVILPFYREVRKGEPTVQPLVDPLQIDLRGRETTGRLLAAKIDRPWRPLLVEQEEFFDRDGLYTDPVTGKDYPDNPARFTFFAKAVLAAMQAADKPYDVVHANDWQGALVIAYLAKYAGDDPKLKQAATVFTIHNLGYQGIFPPAEGAVFDLDAAFHPEEFEFFGKWNLLKGALVNADQLTTVSMKYAKEIQTEELGFGLHGVLSARAERLTGITHGVDAAVWDPNVDPYIAAPFRAGKMAGKQKCKKDLLDAFGISDEWIKKPVLGFIGRLIEQKGLDLVSAIIEDILAHNFLLVLLGTGEKKYESMLSDLQQRFPEKIGVHIGFSEKLAHQIVAGSDLLLLPSIYEPCGLPQMYAHKYGTLPVVRATGGLDDTVSGWTKGKRNADGFKFVDPEPEALLKTLADAAMLYDDKERWNKLVTAAMKLDHSWEKAADKYLRLYQRAMRLKKGTPEA